MAEYIYLPESELLVDDPPTEGCPLTGETSQATYSYSEESGTHAGYPGGSFSPDRLFTIVGILTYSPTSFSGTCTAKVYNWNGTGWTLIRTTPVVVTINLRCTYDMYRTSATCNGTTCTNYPESGASEKVVCVNWKTYAGYWQSRRSGISGSSEGTIYNAENCTGDGIVVGASSGTFTATCNGYASHSSAYSGGNEEFIDETLTVI